MSKSQIESEKKMRNYQLNTDQSLEFAADLDIRIVDESFDSELEKSSIRVYAANNRLFANFAATIKIFKAEDADEYVLVDVDHRGIDLMYALESNEIISCGDFAEITEFQTRNTSSLEELRQIVDSQLLIELQINVE